MDLFGIEMLSGVLGIVFLAMVTAFPLAMLIIFKDKTVLFPRKKYTAWIYHLRQGAKIDENERPKTENFVFDRAVSMWEAQKNKIPMAMLETGIVSAIEVDAAIFASMVEIGGKDIIQLWELAPGVKKTGNYLPIDLPSEVSYERWKGYVSGRGKNMINDIRQEWSRPKDTSLLTAVVLPIVALLVCLVLVIVSLDAVGKNMDKATGIYSGTVSDSTRQIVAACGGHYTEKNTTQAEAPKQNVLPFFG